MTFVFSHQLCVRKIRLSAMLIVAYRYRLSHTCVNLLQLSVLKDFSCLILQYQYLFQKSQQNNSMFSSIKSSNIDPLTCRQVNMFSSIKSSNIDPLTCRQNNMFSSIKSSNIDPLTCRQNNMFSSIKSSNIDPLTCRRPSLVLRAMTR